MARRSTKLLRFENSIYRYDKDRHTWSAGSVNDLSQETKINVVDKGTNATCKHMSQKVNPILLRRGFLDYWDSTSYINFKELSVSNNKFCTEVLVKEYLEMIFKSFSLILDTLKIKRTQDTVYLEISFYQKRDILRRDLLVLPYQRGRFNKVLSDLSLDSTDNFTVNPFFEQKRMDSTGRDKSLTLNYAKFISYLESKISKFFDTNVHIKLVRQSNLLDSANLLAKFFAIEVERSNANFKRALNETFREVKNQSKIKGLRINCSGRLGKAPMAKMEWFKYGQIPLSCINAKLDYSHSTSSTKYGTIGTKIWLYLHDG